MFWSFLENYGYLRIFGLSVKQTFCNIGVIWKLIHRILCHFLFTFFLTLIDVYQHLIEKVNRFGFYYSFFLIVLILIFDFLPHGRSHNFTYEILPLRNKINLFFLDIAYLGIIVRCWLLLRGITQKSIHKIFIKIPLLILYFFE